MPEPNISICQDVEIWQIFVVGGDFAVQQVVELLWARPLEVSVAGVRVVEFGVNKQKSAPVKRKTDRNLCKVVVSTGVRSQLLTPDVARYLFDIRRSPYKPELAYYA